MEPEFKQLIPGNPGTSFVTALMYAINKKYEIEIDNEEQLALFTDGIVKSRKVFFSGVLNTIAQKFGNKVYAFANNGFIVNWAKEEVDKDLVEVSFNELRGSKLEEIIDEYGYAALSVDSFCFNRLYHDYHFCCVSKKGSDYVVFEPKNGNVSQMGRNKFMELAESTFTGLKDSTMAFCV